MTAHGPVAMIGLDATDLALVDRLCAEGRMPNLRALREAGVRGRLAGPARQFSGGVWPTLYAARGVPWHGIYQHRMWRAERMRHELIDADWLPVEPFWQHVGRAGARVALVDVPMVAGPPRALPGVHLSGWGTHDLIHKGSWPGGLWDEVARELGPPVIRPDGYYGPPTVATLLRIRDDLLRGTGQLGRIAEALLGRERWDLLFVVLGATHRGGHHFWDLSQIDTRRAAARDLDRLRGTLADLYEAADAALGRIVAALPAGTRTIALAVHGMGPNSGWAERCGDLVARVAAGRPQAETRRGVLFEARRMLSTDMRRRLRRFIPRAVRERLAELSAPRFDWSATRYFPVDMDLAGYLRVNLRGREAEGIVAPGAEYEAVRGELAAALASFRDIESGAPVVAAVRTRDELAPGDAPYRDVLPDLVVEWGDVSAIASRGVVSPELGEIRWNDGGRLPSGRSGNHRAEGWFAAAGPGIAPGADAAAHDVADVVPTVLDWLGIAHPPDHRGRPIPSLAAR